MKRYYSVKDLSKRYNVDITTIRTWVRKGFIKKESNRKFIYVSKESVSEFEEGIPHLLDTGEIRIISKLGGK
jgi:DNA-binding transcriptional MerR regulator